MVVAKIDKVEKKDLNIYVIYVLHGVEYKIAKGRKFSWYNYSF